MQSPIDKVSAAGGAVSNSFLMHCWGALATVMAVVYTIVLSPIAAIVSPIGDGYLVDAIGRFWSRLIIRTSGIRLKFEGMENIAGLDGYIVVSNHQSALDIFALMGYLPQRTRFVAKKELLKIPVFGYALRRAGHIVIDRDQGGKEVRKAARLSKSRFAIVFFAEGTRFSDGQVHPFSEGAAWLAALTHLPCIPVAISGSAAAFPRGAFAVRPGRTITLRLGAPVPTAHLRGADRAALTHELETRVRALFETPSSQG